jgi:hypothetical protein
LTTGREPFKAGVYRERGFFRRMPFGAVRGVLVSRRAASPAEEFCEIGDLIPSRFFYFSRPGRNRYQDGVFHFRKGEEGEPLNEFFRKEMSYRPGSAEFIRGQKPAVKSAIGKERDDPVKVTRVFFPAGKTAVPLGDKGPSADRTAPGPFRNDTGHTIAAETVPGFPGIEEGSAAKGASGGKKVFPDKKEQPQGANPIHTLYRASGCGTLQ